MATARRLPASRARSAQALFVLITADHVFGEGGLERLLARPGSRPCSSILHQTGRPGGRGPGSGSWTRPSSVRQAPGGAGHRLRAFLLPSRCSTASARRPPRRPQPGRGRDPPGPDPAPAGGRPAARCWWQDVDTPRTRGRPGWRCAARWARTPTGRSAAGSTGPCRPGCRWSWPAAARARSGVAGRVHSRLAWGSCWRRPGPGRRAAGPRTRSPTGWMGVARLQLRGAAARAAGRAVGPGGGCGHPGRAWAVGAGRP